MTKTKLGRCCVVGDFVGLPDVDGEEAGLSDCIAVDATPGKEHMTKTENTIKKQIDPLTGYNWGQGMCIFPL